MPRALRRAERSEARLNARGGDFDLRVGISLAVCLHACIWRVALSALRLLACGEPEAFAVHLQDMNVMGEAIEQRAGEAL